MQQSDTDHYPAHACGLSGQLFVNLLVCLLISLSTKITQIDKLDGLLTPTHDIYDINGLYRNNSYMSHLQCKVLLLKAYVSESD